MVFEPTLTHGILLLVGIGLFLFSNSDIRVKMRVIGWYLLIDGVLSIYFSLPDECLNNTPFGQAIRVIRAIIGAWLIWHFR